MEISTLSKMKTLNEAWVNLKTLISVRNKQVYYLILLENGGRSKEI